MGNDAKEPREPGAPAPEPARPELAPTEPAFAEGSEGPRQTLDLAVGTGDPADTTDRFDPGATFEHFVVRRQIGAGGMGVVLEAHDPDLDRTVAIKVVRGVASSTRAADLVREAQAMARLSHPNVVAIYEVGRAEGEVFLVMEHVTGQTLGQWCDERSRSVVELVRLFIAAGEGLVAAHGVGLVHRDFKPSNVLVDDEGRPRVTDFGIAHFTDRELAAVPAGTVGYMAPEQIAGGEVDHRVDQYAFCVALDQALSEHRRLPPRLVRALERGSAEDADDRFDSMRALLDELAAAVGIERESRRPQLLGPLALVMSAAVVSVVFVASRDTRSTCERGAEVVGSVWSTDARAALEAAFVSTGRSHARATAARVSSLFDSYAESWKLGRRLACEADADVRADRLRCLDHRLGTLGAQISAFTAAPTDVGVDNAVRAAIGLPGIEDCARIEAARGPGLESSHPAVMAVDELAALRASGQLVAASERLDAAIAGAEASNNTWLLARALLVAGRVEADRDRTDEARGHLARAARTAAEAGDDTIMASALLRQASAMVNGGKPSEALGILDAADAVITRAGLDELRARLSLRRGEALAQAGRGNEGIPLLRAAVAEAEKRAERDPRARAELARTLGILSAAHTKRREYGPSRVAIERAMAIEKEVLGRGHPEVAASLHDLAVTEVRMGEYDAGLEHYMQARDVFLEAYGADHPHIGRISLSLGNLELLRGRLAEAEPHYAQARANLEKSLGPDHPHLAIASTGLAAIYRDSDRCADAVPHYRASVGIYDRAGVAGASVSNALTGLGVCLMETGDAKGSRTALERALRELESAELGPVQMAEARAALAQTLWIEGREKQRALALARTVIESIADETDPVVAPLRAEVKAWIPEWEAALRVSRR